MKNACFLISAKAYFLYVSCFFLQLNCLAIMQTLFVCLFDGTGFVTKPVLKCSYVKWHDG